MRIKDEIQAIYDKNIEENIGETFELLRGEILRRVRGGDKEWQCLRVAVNSIFVKEVLEEWAEENGLDVTIGGDMAGRITVNIIWGLTPMMQMGCFASISNNGKLILKQEG